MGSITNQLTLIAAILMILLAVRPCDAGFPYHKAYVEIKNDLPQGPTLTVICKSKDNDLGQHELNLHETFFFKFNPSFLGSTRFWCSFQWNNGPVYFYDVYKQSRDYGRCENCLWSIRPEGPCLFNSKTNAYDLCDKWNAK